MSSKFDAIICMLIGILLFDNLTGIVIAGHPKTFIKYYYYSNIL